MDWFLRWCDGEWEVGCGDISLAAELNIHSIIFIPEIQQSDVDEKELLDSFIGLWQQPTQNHPETCQRYEEEEFIPKDKVRCIFIYISVFTVSFTFSSGHQLFEIMTKYGEKLSDEEAAEMVRECRPDSQGRIFFENYRRMLIDTTT
jgi:hypothetical protein